MDQETILLPEFRFLTPKIKNNITEPKKRSKIEPQGISYRLLFYLFFYKKPNKSAKK